MAAARLEAKRVLVVDDDVEVRGVIERMLRTLGQDVVTAENGEEALGMLSSRRPDAMIADVLMPGELGGLELARRAEKDHPGLPILLVSGVPSDEDLSWPLLTKPFRLADLEIQLRRLLG